MYIHLESFHFFLSPVLSLLTPTHHSVFPGQLFGGLLTSLPTLPKSILAQLPGREEPRGVLSLLCLRPASTPSCTFRVQLKCMTVTYMFDTIRFLLVPFLPGFNSSVLVFFFCFECCPVFFSPGALAPVSLTGSALALAQLRSQLLSHNMSSSPGTQI